MAKFSLIIPYHNSPIYDRSEMIHELLCSLPDREDLEVLLVDDNSNEPFHNRHDFRKTTYRHIANAPGRRYAGTARNTGIEESSGEFLFFADSDDRFDTGKLSRVMDSLRSAPDVDLVVGRTVSFKEDGSIGDRHHYIDELLDSAQESGDLDPLLRLHSPGAKFVRRSFLFENGIFYGDSRVANDVLFCIRLMSSHPKTRLVEDVIYHLRQGNDALTTDVSRDAARIRIRVAREAQGILKQAGLAEKRWPIAQLCLKYSRDYPFLAAWEILVSVIRRDRLVSSRTRAIKRLFGLI